MGDQDPVSNTNNLNIPDVLVGSVQFAVRNLINPLARFDLIELCANPDHQVPAVHVDYLKSQGLMREDGKIRSDVREIILGTPEFQELLKQVRELKAWMFPA